MPIDTTITVETHVEQTPRVMQVQGMFDLTAEKSSKLTWQVAMDLDAKPWNIGLIVGPSGCGKSSIARNLWPTPFTKSATLTWPQHQSLLDSFPETLPIQEITTLLSSVGFSSPPAWLRPFHVLSTGQQFRVSLARLLAESSNEPIVFDEYTSVVDRTVAQIGSAAVARVIRHAKKQFIAVTCHEDVEPWLQPDWVYRPAEQTFAWRSLRRRPAIDLVISRCSHTAWPLFARHHYLSAELNRSAVCFLATLHNQPVCFSSWLPFVGAGPPARREHRTVCLPDYQGIGIGNRISVFCASLFAGLGYRAVSTTTHPAMIRSRLASTDWRMTRKPSFAARDAPQWKRATTRLTAGFEFIGPPAPYILAKTLIGA